MRLSNVATVTALFLTAIPLIPDSAFAYQTITCDSRHGRRNTCYVGGVRIRSMRQLSNASCDGNWNYDGQRIAVRNGCRAQFVIDDGGRRGYDRPDYRDNYYDDRREQRRYDRPYHRHRNYPCNGYDYRCN